MSTDVSGYFPYTVKLRKLTVKRKKYVAEFRANFFVRSF